jgi:DNA primase
VPDGDPPGYQAADRIVNTLGAKMDVRVYPTPLNKDPDELTDKEIDQIFATIA